LTYELSISVFAMDYYRDDSPFGIKQRYLCEVHKYFKFLAIYPISNAHYVRLPAEIHRPKYIRGGREKKKKGWGERERERERERGHFHASLETWWPRSCKGN
jgi:hypothetical protein